MEIEQLAVERPDALAKVAGRRRSPASMRPRRARSRRRPSSPTSSSTRSPTCWSSSGRPSSATDATLVEVNPLARVGDGTILALDGKVTLDDNADFRQPGNAELRRRRRDRPARAEGQGEAPQLRQARRRGRHHRQRRRPGHVHARRRRLRRREARRGQAGELPRHRWRRVGRGDGQRARHHPERPGRQERVRERLRRHHRLRRGGQRHRRRAGHPRGRGRPSRWSCASTATMSSRAGAS